MQRVGTDLGRPIAGLPDPITARSPLLNAAEPPAVVVTAVMEAAEAVA